MNDNDFYNKADDLSELKQKYQFLKNEQTFSNILILTGNILSMLLVLIFIKPIKLYMLSNPIDLIIIVLILLIISFSLSWYSYLAKMYELELTAKENNKIIPLFNKYLYSFSCGLLIVFSIIISFGKKK